jgi:hypothetical protein
MVAAILVPRVDLDQVYRLLVIATFLSIATFVVAVVGEVLGWWRDFGELLGLAAGILSVLLGTMALLLGATKTQVTLVAGAAVEGSRKHDESNLKLDAANGKLDAVSGKIDVSNELLRDIRDRLPASR